MSPGLSIYLPLSLAPVVGLAGVLIGVTAVLHRRTAVYPPVVLVGFQAAFSILIVASLLWSFDPSVSQRNFVKLIPTLICGVLIVGASRSLGAEERNSVSRCLLAGLALAGAIVVAELAAGGILITLGRPPFDENQFLNYFGRGLIVCSLLFWAAVDRIVRRGMLWGVVALAVAIGLLLNFLSEAAFVAIAVGAGTFALVRVVPRHAGLGLSVLVAVAFLSFPFVVRSLPPPETTAKALSLQNSALHRLQIWEFTADKIHERPILGWGFDASRVIPGGKRRIVGEAVLPLHPHNGVLQVWLELGVVGALLGAAFLVYIAETIRRRAADVTAQATASAALCSTLLVFLVSFGSWQTWWVSAMIVVAACTVAICGRREDDADTPSVHRAR